MKTKVTIVAFLLSCISQKSFAQPPLVYGVENSGAACKAPPLPAFGDLPIIEPLPDPFRWADGSGRSTNFSDWECRRNEIKAQIEHFEIGKKPAKPENITASYADGVLTVIVTENGQTLTLTSQVVLPEGDGPFPAVIGMNSGSGSIPATVFSTRNIARITFSHNQVTTYSNPQLTDPYFQLYPDQNLDNAGQYSAWSWGVSRIIDGLELVKSSLKIDLEHLAVTGCSYAGKMALFAGAFDERIALTIAQESGGGGAPAWRVSHNVEPNGSVEKIDNTDYKWFREELKQFSGDNVYRLPYDHHELMAMIAPRALLITGNTDYTWLSNKAAYMTASATKEIYKTLGISDRMGFYIDGGHGHCAVPNSQVPAVQAFVDRFLLDSTQVITDTVTVHPFPELDPKRWYQWWGSDNPVLPPPPGRKIWLEAECATVGSSWDIVSDTSASNEKYIAVKSGLSSPTSAPETDDAIAIIPFNIDSAATYKINARLFSPTGTDYTYWYKVDNGSFKSVSSVLLTNGGFENGRTGWTTLNSQGGATLTATTNADEVRTGTGALKVVNPTAQTGNQWRVQLSSTAFPTTIGKKYKISYWVKAATEGGSIRLSTGPTSAQYQGDQTIGTAWKQISWTITASLSSTTFLFDMGQVANTYFIDDASVMEEGGEGGWQWITLKDTALSVGAHSVTFAYGEGIVKLDKLYVTTFADVISGKGEAAKNCIPPPSVYKVENSGASCPTPVLPEFAALPVIEPLPDPFMWSDNSGRSIKFSDWECRRNEIKAEIEHYEIGTKPPKPETITANYADGVLTVNVTVNGKSLTLTSQISLPSGSGPFPAVIGMNSPSGSIPASVFTNRNIARITYNHNQVTTYGNPQLANPYYQLYPDQNLENAGQYSAWAWGVSRIIDGLELVQASLPIDLDHLGVTGCSYAGKMALFAGAFDERIALTIAQESGGGGAPAWRFSETLGSVEKLGATDYRWFKDDMKQFSGTNVSKLPHDHHELMAMVAPRALLVTGNTDFEWLANPSTYVSARAAHEVWKTFGIGDRFGFYIDGGHGHCAIPNTQLPAVEAFVEKFLGGNPNVNTDTVTIHPYPLVNHKRWYEWWGTGNPVLAAEPPGKRIWLEAECGKVGEDWELFEDTEASNDKYIVVKSGLNSTAAAPGENGLLTIKFTVDSAATYNFVARVNCPTADDDSYWVKVDNGTFANANGLNGSGWQWVRLVSANLSVGEHTLTIGYREDGAKLDKILVTTSGATITGKGDLAINCDGPLPVNLINYQATARTTGDVLLQWITSSENNSKYYRLERSQNANDYVLIGTVAAKGNSSSQSSYSFIDNKPLSGTNYYRLVQIDLDGRETSLGVKAVSINGGEGAVRIYPSPAHSEFNISLGTNESAQKNIDIYNISGKKVFSKKLNVVNGIIKVKLDQHQAAGIYMVKIGDNDKVSIILK
jgi:dienelactone hydrolase